MRLLLVEDNRQLSDWVAKTLRAERYTVDCVYAGDDADHVLRTEEYALVILDLALPELGGLEILRKLRARGSTVPVSSSPPTTRSTRGSRGSTAAPTTISPNRSR